jgi:hypothetical protein
MNRKFAALAVLALVPLHSALADPDAGCGAGSKIWVGQSGTPYKLMAATTNGSFGNQTFGISSGTLGCHQDGTVTAENRIPMFAAANLDQLAADMADGHGDTLTALAALYGIPDQDRAGFYTLAQTHYGSIFTAASISSNSVVAALNAVMKSDSYYSRFVS